MAIGGYPPHKTATVKNFIVAGNELDLSRNKLMMKALEGGVPSMIPSVKTLIRCRLKSNADTI